jgi:CheY-like chemotaxis protein
MKVLHISTHPELLVLGSAYLQALGFHVAAVGDLPGVLDLFEGGEEFDLVILCHTLDLAEKRFICKFIRARCPLARILELYLTEPHVTLGVAVDATTEFHCLMRILALDGANSEIIPPLRQARSNASMTWTKLG